MKNQTAVEWLFETMAKTPMTNWYEVRLKAKQMEKDQLIKAIEDWYTFDFESAEQYYNKTYGQSCLETTK